MSKLLNLKNREDVINNKKSADFYVLTLLSKDILEYDKLRIKDYLDFYRKNNLKQNDNYDVYAENKLKKYFINTIFSTCLIFYFKSYLIIPIFFSSIYISKKIFNKFLNKKEDALDSCYFCQRKIHKQKLTEKYSDYHVLIKHILEKNSKVDNLDDFEKELDKIINENKLEFIM